MDFIFVIILSQKIDKVNFIGIKEVWVVIPLVHIISQIPEVIFLV